MGGRKTSVVFMDDTRSDNYKEERKEKKKPSQIGALTGKKKDIDH